MPLTDLLQAIQAEADDEIAADLRALRAEADATVAEASIRAHALERELELRATAESRVDAGRRIAAARLAAVRQVRLAREEAYLALRADLAEELRSARHSPAYPRLLGELIQGAIAALPGTVLIRVDPRDAITAQVLLASTVPPVTLEASLSTWGGIHAVDPDGRTVINTLEQRLVDAEPCLRMLYARTIVTAGSESS